MSKYTTEVRFICEEAAGYTESQGYGKINEVITKALPKVFDFTFPMYEGESREALERKNLNHYYFREIGLETVSLWKHFMMVRLTEIMPYYVDLWKQRVNDFTPDGNIDYYEAFREDTAGKSQETGERTGRSTTAETGTEANAGTGTITTNTDREGHKTGTTTNAKSETISRDAAVVTDKDTRDVTDRDTTEGSTRPQNLTTTDKYSDTPQGALTGLENDSYLTNARKVVNGGSETVSGTGTDDSTVTGTEDTTVTTDEDVTTSGTDTETYNITDATDEEQTVTRNTTDTLTRNLSTTGNETETNKRNGTETGSTESLMHKYGITDARAYLDMKEKLLQLILNIDVEIINNLSDLFFGLY